MKSLHHRVARLLDEVRRRQVDAGERIACVVVELPADADFPIGSERLIFPALGRRPAVMEVAV